MTRLFAALLLLAAPLASQEPTWEESEEMALAYTEFWVVAMGALEYALQRQDTCRSAPQSSVCLTALALPISIESQLWLMDAVGKERGFIVGEAGEARYIRRFRETAKDRAKSAARDAQRYDIHERVQEKAREITRTEGRLRAFKERWCGDLKIRECRDVQ